MTFVCPRQGWLQLWLNGGLLSLLEDPGVGREGEVTLFLCRGHGGGATHMVAQPMRAEDFVPVLSAPVGFLSQR